MSNAYDSRVQLNKHDLRSLKPRITQYKGVRFRSKSEAVFARCLDLAGVPWMYEPFDGKEMLPAGHQWDFLLFLAFEKTPRVRCGPHVFELPGFDAQEFEAWFIEYKPRLPNLAYFESLAEGLRLWEHSYSYTNFGVVSGSPWNDSPYEMHPIAKNDKLCIRPDDYLTHHDLIDNQAAMKHIWSFTGQAMQYRFDICDSSAESFIDYRSLY